MAVASDHHLILKKLKKKIRLLERKEELARIRLRQALARIRKLSRSYKSKLASKSRRMKAKVAEVQASTYVKSAQEMERHMLQGIETKGRALASALIKIEKKYATRLKKSLARKGKRNGKSKSTAEPASKKMKKAARKSR
ncbi:hypothetical protein AQUSIP_16120 [Aquicella siphonis]|uniref:Uncharacterized protein n=1 Tax=Aquicella siphonis TaxID=254247 RepID=A0A5E4PIR3_9COXI|nr:hypothetical protein [Aquicella siphonis]VVC76303.1 hypothetical protein AQUSIP_16120 [Aquicella siphonis]